MKLNTVLLFVILVLSQSTLFAQKQDTVLVSIKEAEGQFLKNNLSLIAANYSIDIAQAQARQARVWDNPVLNTDQTLYDGRFFRHSKETGSQQAMGEVYIQVQQLIRTTGKIRKLTAIASANVKVAQLQFDQMMHSLRYTLRNDLYQVSQLLQTIALYEQEKVQLGKLVTAMQAEFKAGNISQKDLLRVQALQLSSLQEETEYRKTLSDVETDLRTLLKAAPNAFIVPALPTNKPTNIPSLDSLLALAKQYNPDLLVEGANLGVQQQNLRYQQALRSPDVTVGVQYDRLSSYTPNYWGLDISLPLPLFNKNQGNIAAAGFSVKQEQAVVDMRQQKLVNDLQNAIQKITLAQETQAATDPELMKKYNTLLANAIRAYQDRKLGLLEFIDLFGAYKDTQLKYLQQQYYLSKAKEDLNLLTGKDVY